MHKIILDFNHSPIFFQFWQGARHRTVKIYQEFIRTIIDAGCPGAIVGLVSIGCTKASIGLKLKRVTSVVTRFILFVKEIGDFPASSCRGKIVIARIIAIGVVVAGSQRKKGEQ